MERDVRRQTVKRQPLLPTYVDAPVEIGAAVIEKTSRLAELIGRIAINWSGVEVQLSLALGSMLGVENPASVAVFLSLRNHRAQRDALRAAGDKALAGEIAEIFAAILARHDELDSQRNSAVHKIWGIAHGPPDGIIWSSQQNHANMLIMDYHMEKAGTLTHETRLANMKKELFTVRYADLEELNRDILGLDRVVGRFHAYLRYSGEPAGRHALKELRDDAVISAIRDRARGKATAPNS